MSQLTYLGGFPFILKRAPEDFRDVKLIAGTAALGNEVVIYDQLQAASALANAAITDEAAFRLAADQLLRQDFQSADTSIINSISQIQGGVSKYVAVGARVTSLIALGSAVPGIDQGTTYLASDHNGWILVDGIDETENGIYRVPSVGQVVRVTDVLPLTAGTEVYVTAGTYTGTLWKLPDGEDVNETNQDILKVIPWVSPIDLTIAPDASSQFLSRIDRRLHAELDADYLTVLNGALTWATPLKTWKTTLDASLVGINASLADLSSNVQALDSTVVGQASAISSLNSVVTSQTTTLQTLTSNYGTLSINVQSAIDANSTQDEAISTLQYDLSVVTNTNNYQEVVIAGLLSDVSIGTSTNNTQDTAISTLQTTVTNQAATIATQSASITTQNATIASLESSLAAKVSAADSLNQIVAFKRATSLVRTLTNGTFADGVTTFSINLQTELTALPSGGVFRRVSFNGAITPYTQSGEPIVNYPNNNVEVLFVSTTQVPDGEVEIALEAFFRAV